MNRRIFLASTLLVVAEVAVPTISAATENDNTDCVPNLEFVSAEITYKQVYTHYHLLSIPIYVLKAPPAEGYTTETSSLDVKSLDVAAFDGFTNSRKYSEVQKNSLRHHSHEVTITQAELQRIAGGEKNVKILILSKGKLPAHYAYFTASKSALNKIKRGS